MRKIDEYQNTPILMITAHDDIKDVIKCMEKGASGYLIKPWMEEEFHEKVISSWSKHKSTDTN